MNKRRAAWSFSAPLLVITAIAGAVWLSTSGSDDRYGPMLRVPFSPARSSTDAPTEGTGEAPPSNMDEKLSPMQAALRNAAIPFSRGALLAPAHYASTVGGQEDAAAALDCMTSAVYYEAGHEPLVGKEAVAQVVVNRWASPPFPKTICGVVRQGAPRPGCQFTFECDGSLARRPDPATWASSRTVALAALNGFTLSIVGGATHYHADYVVPVWAMTMIKLVKLGQHIFYRWPGARFSPVPITPPSAPIVPDVDNGAAPLPISGNLLPGTVGPQEAQVTPPLGGVKSPTTTTTSSTPLSTVAAEPPAPTPKQTSSHPASAPPRRALPEQSLRGLPF